MALKGTAFSARLQCAYTEHLCQKKKFRDMLFVTFAATKSNQSDNLFHFEKDFFDSVWKKESKLRSMLCKPIGIKKTFEFLNF